MAHLQKNVMNALTARKEVLVTIEELARGDVKTCTVFVDLWIDGVGCSKDKIERKVHIDLKNMPMDGILMGRFITIYGLGHVLHCVGASYTGNLLVAFNVQKHSIYNYDLTGSFPYDLSSTIYISLVDFFKGTSFFAIPHPSGEGEPIMIEYKSGKRVCVKKCCGLQGRGDIYYYFEVIMPYGEDDIRNTLSQLKEL